MPTFARFKRQMADSPLLQRWGQLPPRDRQALGVLLVFLGLVLLYLLVWQPVSRRLQEAEAHYRAQVELHGYLLRHAERARQSSEPSREVLSPERLQSLVTASAQQSGLSIERLDRDEQSLQLVLARTEFKRLLHWLAALQAQGVVFAEVSLRRSSVGQVEARLSLAL